MELSITLKPFSGEELNDKKDIQSLILQSNCLNTIPKQVIQLKSLRSLTINWNLLVALPPGVCGMFSLQNLDCSFNKLQFLPQNIGVLTNLTRLVASDNQLKVLPSSLSSLEKLEEFSVQYNQLNSMPPQLANLRKLRMLSCSGNQFIDKGLQDACHDGTEAVISVLRDQLLIGESLNQNEGSLRRSFNGSTSTSTATAAITRPRTAETINNNGRIRTKNKNPIVSASIDTAGLSRLLGRPENESENLAFSLSGMRRLSERNRSLRVIEEIPRSSELSPSNTNNVQRTRTRNSNNTNTRSAAAPPPQQQQQQQQLLVNSSIRISSLSNDNRNRATQQQQRAPPPPPPQQQQQQASPPTRHHFGLSNIYNDDDEDDEDVACVRELLRRRDEALLYAFDGMMDDLHTPSPMSSPPTANLSAKSTSPSKYVNNNNNIKSESFNRALPNHFYCPITHEIMKEPVVAADGHTYERTAIVKWLEQSIKSPMTGEKMKTTAVVPNWTLHSLIQNYIS